MGKGSMRLLVRSDGNFFGSMVVDGIAYEARIEGDETIIYSSADGELAENPFENDTVLEQIAEARQPTQGDEPLSAAISSSPTVITVGVLIGNALGASAVDVYGFIEWQIVSANEAYQNSGVDLVFSVVAITNYQPGSGTTMYQRLQFITCGTNTCSTDGFCQCKC